MEYLARIDVALAGRVAEELAFGEENLSDRTHEDLGRASYIADAMVKVSAIPLSTPHRC